MDELFVNHKTHKIDAKGRISIPADMRANLGQEFIASRGSENALLSIRWMSGTDL